MRVQLHPAACGCPVVPAAFLEETVLSPLSGLAPLVEYQFAIEMEVFPDPSALFHWPVSLRASTTPHTDLVTCFAVNFSNGHCGSCHTVLLLQDFLGFSDSLAFLYEF